MIDEIICLIIILIIVYVIMTAGIIKTPMNVMDVISFRNHYMSGTNVNISLSKLNEIAEQGLIASIWNDLSIDEKKNITATLHNYLISNEPNAFKTYYITNPALCLPNAIIRWTRFTSHSLTESLASCTYYDGEGTLHSYHYNKSYGLTTWVVNILHPGFYHSILAVLVGTDPTNFNHWHFLQYNDSNVIPGSWNMPVSSDIWLWSNTQTECTGLAGGTIHTWHIDENGIATYTGIFG